MRRFIPFLILMACGCLVAAEPNEQERKEAQEEEEKESKLPEVEQIALTKAYMGTLQLIKNEENPEVVGQLVTTTGPMILKLSQPTLLKELVPFNQKTISLTGKLRNNGKYLLVTSVVGAPPPAFERKKRGGI